MPSTSRETSPQEFTPKSITSFFLLIFGMLVSFVQVFQASLRKVLSKVRFTREVPETASRFEEQSEKYMLELMLSTSSLEVLLPKELFSFPLRLIFTVIFIRLQANLSTVSSAFGSRTTTECKDKFGCTVKGRCNAVSVDRKQSWMFIACCSASEKNC